MAEVAWLGSTSAAKRLIMVMTAMAPTFLICFRSLGHISLHGW